MLEQLKELWTRHDLLQDAWQECYRMLDVAHEMYGPAVRALRQSDGGDALDGVVERDRTVDALHQEVRRMVMTHAAVRPQADLPAAMVLITVVNDVERIGDYAKNVAELARSYPQRLEGGPLEADVARVEEAVEANFGRVRRCIEDGDEALAREVLEAARELSELCSARLHELVHAPNDALQAHQATALALYLRYLKRINGHLGDIATAVAHPFDRIGVKSPA